MKITSLCPFVVSLAAFATGSVYAQQADSTGSAQASPAANAAAPAPTQSSTMKAIENAFTPYGLIQINANYLDSQRKNVPDFNASNLRAGLIIKAGIVSGQTEFQYVGNNPVAIDSNNKPISASNNTVVIRQAQLNLDALTIKNGANKYVTTVSLGGVRVGGALATAPDIAYTPSGYGRQDGLYLRQTANFGKTLELNLGFGVFNNISTLAPPSASQANQPFPGWGFVALSSMQAPWSGNGSYNKSLGYLGDLGAVYNLTPERTFTLLGYYGMQKNAPTNTTNQGDLSAVRNVSHTEASLTYNDTAILGKNGVISGNGATVWYEDERNGHANVATSDNNGGYNYAPSSVNDSSTASIIGLSVAADSENYLTDMLQFGDRLTYSVSYTNLKSRFGDAGYSPNYVINTVSASVGYAASTLETAINFAYNAADRPVFATKGDQFAPANGIGDKRALKGYVTMAYIF